MNIKEPIEQSLNVSDMIVSKYLDDLKPEAFFRRPIDGMNHLAWQMGHLITTENKWMEAIKPGASPALPAGFHEQHAKETHDRDATAFLTKDDYLALWKSQRAATKEILAGLSEAELEAPCPIERMRSMCPTVAQMLNLAGLHALMHAGQFVAVRRQEAMPIAF